MYYIVLWYVIFRRGITVIVKSLRINNQIRVANVRVVGEKRAMGVMPTLQALEIAAGNGRLVEVAPPPNHRFVESLITGNSLRTTRKKKRPEKPKVSELREIRLRPKIGDHDLEFKYVHKNFLIDGDKVRVTVMFRDVNQSRRPWLEIVTESNTTLEGVAVVERPALMEGRRMFIILAPAAAQKSKPKEGSRCQVKDS